MLADSMQIPTVGLNIDEDMDVYILYMNTVCRKWGPPYPHNNGVLG